MQLLFLVITGAMSHQAGASAGQACQGVRVGCLERRGSWADRRQTSFKGQVAHRARQARRRAWGVSGKRLGEHHRFREQDSGLQEASELSRRSWNIDKAEVGKNC